MFLRCRLRRERSVRRYMRKSAEHVMSLRCPTDPWYREHDDTKDVQLCARNASDARFPRGVEVGYKTDLREHRSHNPRRKLGLVLNFRRHGKPFSAACAPPVFGGQWKKTKERLKWDSNSKPNGHDTNPLLPEPLMLHAKKQTLKANFCVDLCVSFLESIRLAWACALSNLVRQNK